MRNQATGHSSSRPSLLDRQTRAEEVPDFMRTPSSRHSIPGPPASPRLKQHHRIGEHGLPRAVMLRALSWCILARRDHNSVLHMLSATPTCHPYWWCAGAGITLERHSMLRHENRCRCPYTYVSLRVPLSARLRRRRNYINSRRQNLHALCPLGLSERPRRYASYFQQLPLHICEKACASTFVSRCNAIAVSYCSVVSIYLANDCCAFVCHPA